MSSLNGYPNVLKPISWKMAGLAGPLKYWNKYLPNEVKGNEYFWQTVIKRIFNENGVENFSRELMEFINYIMKTHSIRFRDDLFSCVLKRDKEKNVIFNEQDFERIGKQCGFKTLEACNSMLEYLIKQSCDVYNKILSPF